MTYALPQQFEKLQPYVAHWTADTSQRRFEIRCESSMPALEEFYSVMVENGAEIFAYLDQFPLNDMPEDAQLLFKMFLSLAHVAMSVEIHKQPRVPNSNWPNGLTITKGAVPFG